METIYAAEGYTFHSKCELYQEVMMAQKSKGFITLEWVCPGCGTRNPGPQQTCTNCGSPQPDNVEFQMGSNRGFVTEENEIKRAAAGADIICAYCNTRNLAANQVCLQCGSNLKEGKQRASGRELSGGTMAAEVTCKNCSEINLSANLNCAKCGTPLPRPDGAAPPAARAINVNTPAKTKISTKVWIALGAVLFLCIGLFTVLAIMSSVERESVHTTVQGVSWHTKVALDEYREVHYSSRSSAPTDAYNVSCSESSHEVCTDKTIDKGNGYAEVVQDCRTEHETSCSYDIMEWQLLRNYELDGHDLSPVYSKPSLTSNQRLGDTSVTLKVNFASGHDYTPANLAEFRQFKVGSRWKLRISMLDTIIEAISSP